MSCPHFRSLVLMQRHLDIVNDVLHDSGLTGDDLLHLARHRERLRDRIAEQKRLIRRTCDSLHHAIRAHNARVYSIEGV